MNRPNKKLVDGIFNQKNEEGGAGQPWVPMITCAGKRIQRDSL